MLTYMLFFQNSKSFGSRFFLKNEHESVVNGCESNKWSLCEKNSCENLIRGPSCRLSFNQSRRFFFLDSYWLARIRISRISNSRGIRNRYLKKLCGILWQFNAIISKKLIKNCTLSPGCFLFRKTWGNLERSSYVRKYTG